jgi:hypothetical protein
MIFVLFLHLEFGRDTNLSRRTILIGMRGAMEAFQISDSESLPCSRTDSSPSSR